MTQEQRLENRETFAADLTANVKEIRKEQADQISEELEIALYRRVEDGNSAVSKINRKRRSILDFTPDTTTTIVKVTNFDADNLADALNAVYIELRTAEVHLEAAIRAYNDSFKNNIEETV